MLNHFRLPAKSIETGTVRESRSRRHFRGATLAGCLLLISSACTVVATRPVQEMSDTAAAIRSAKEVSAETVAPELYRQATEWFFKARNEFKMKNYKYAREYAVKARHYAEQAEFEALRSGANRTEASLSDPYAGEAAPPPPKTEPAPQKPYAYPTPEPTAAKDGDMPPEPTPLPPAPH